MPMVRRFFGAAFLFLFLGAALSAAPVRYTLHNVVFDDGGVASGSFEYDVVTNTYSNVSIETTNGSVRTGAAYVTIQAGGSSNDQGVLLATSTAADQTGLPALLLIFNPFLNSTPGQAITLSVQESSCLNPTCFALTFPNRFAGGTAVSAATTTTADSPFQVRYVANLNVADALINISNTGMNGAMPFGPGIGQQAGNICVNVYAFSPDEQMVGCCSCHITPNGLVSLSVYNDIRAITLTGLTPNSMVIKLVATATGPGPSYAGGAPACSQSAAGIQLTHPLAAGGMAAWATTGHVPGLFPVPGAPAPFAITETRFTPATLSNAEFVSLNNRCTAIIGNGSTFGTCRSCTPGGRGADRN